MRNLLLVLFALMSSTAHAQTGTASSADLEIKGFTVDEILDCDLIATLPEQNYSTYRKESDCRRKKVRTYGFWIPLLGVEAKLIVTTVDDGYVSHVQADGPYTYNTAVKAFTKKYGPPTLRDSVLRNLAGAELPQQQAIWQVGKKTLEILRHSSKVNTPIINLSGSIEAARLRAVSDKAESDI